MGGRSKQTDWISTSAARLTDGSPHRRLTSLSRAPSRAPSMTTDSPPSSRTLHGFQPCPEGTFSHGLVFAAPATILDHRPTSPTCTPKGSFPRGVMGIDRSATISHGDRKQSLQDRGHFGGHPPGVGAAHQPRAEGSIPYGELFGHVMVPGHWAGGITTHCFRIPNHRARMANHHFESPTHHSRTPTARS